MEPASKIIKRVGGEAVMSQITGTSLATPYRWQYPKWAKGTGGIIPQRHHRSILEFSEENNLGIKASDFLPVKDQPSEVPRRPRKYEGVIA